jgi:hypothetical protein
MNPHVAQVALEPWLEEVPEPGAERLARSATSDGQPLRERRIRHRSAGAVVLSVNLVLRLALVASAMDDVASRRRLPDFEATGKAPRARGHAVRRTVSRRLVAPQEACANGHGIENSEPAARVQNGDRDIPSSVNPERAYPATRVAWLPRAGGATPLALDFDRREPRGQNAHTFPCR